MGVLEWKDGGREECACERRHLGCAAVQLRGVATGRHAGPRRAPAGNAAFEGALDHIHRTRASAAGRSAPLHDPLCPVEAEAEGCSHMATVPARRGAAGRGEDSTYVAVHGPRADLGGARASQALSPHHSSTAVRADVSEIWPPNWMATKPRRAGRLTPGPWGQQ